VLYRFLGGTDGAQPQGGDLLFDQAGNIYGTTQGGGSENNGTVYELTPSGGGWTESILYRFTGGNDGGGPLSGLISDGAGNLYGTTVGGGAYGWGTVYELTPSSSGWLIYVLYSFTGGSDGEAAIGGVIFDASGNLYGTTNGGGAGGCPNGCGTLFELSPSIYGGWTYSLLYGEITSWH
jgi:uncharacterized repeat protein (TIGR03803 family)